MVDHFVGLEGRIKALGVSKPSWVLEYAIIKTSSTLVLEPKQYQLAILVSRGYLNLHRMVRSA